MKNFIAGHDLVFTKHIFQDGKSVLFGDHCRTEYFIIRWGSTGQLLALPIPVVLLCFVVWGKCSNIFELVF